MGGSLPVIEALTVLSFHVLSVHVWVSSSFSHSPRTCGIRQSLTLNIDFPFEFEWLFGSTRIVGWTGIKWNYHSNINMEEKSGCFNHNPFVR